MRKKWAVILSGLVLTLVCVAAPVGAHERDMTLRRGDSGKQVEIWQQMLNHLSDRAVTPLTEDGIFGPATERATRQFERESGSKSVRDGVVTTEDRILWLGGFLTGSGTAKPTLLEGTRAPRVGHLQVALNVWITREDVPFDELWVDAIFGSRTEAAVREFQASAGLSSDGMVGPDTWRQMREEELLEFPPSDYP